MTFSKLPVILPLLFSLVSPCICLGSSDTVVGGHLKTLDISYEAAPGSFIEAGFFSANSQRIELTQRSVESYQIEVAIDNLVLYSDPPDQVGLPGESPNRRLDLEREWSRGHRWSDQLQIDRLAVRGSTASLDWSIGRQALGFGRIVIFSPLDVIAPFAPDALDTDVRPGVDAARAVHYFGLAGQIGATIVFGPESDANSYLLTATGNRAEIDFLGIAGKLRDREMFGLGLAGSLGTLGVKVEFSHFRGIRTGEPAGDLHDQFGIGAIELWQRFDNGIVLLAEYLYNGAGASEPADYPAAATSASFAEGLSFLLARNYLLLGPSWEFHPLATLSGLVIRNLDDDSTLLRPQLQLSLADNLSLDLFYSANLGDKPRFIAPGLALPQSEFGSSGDSGGLLLRWYF